MALTLKLKMQSNMGVRRKLSDLERYMRRREHSRRSSKSTVHIGTAIDRWHELRNLKCVGNTDFAHYLLDLEEREINKYMCLAGE